VLLALFRVLVLIVQQKLMTDVMADEAASFVVSEVQKARSHFTARRFRSSLASYLQLVVSQPPLAEVLETEILLALDRQLDDIIFLSVKNLN